MRFGLTMIMLLMIVGGISAQDVPLDRRISTPDGTYSIDVPAGWAAEFFSTPGAVTEARLSPNADVIAQLRPQTGSPLVIVQFYGTPQLARVPAQLDFASKAQIVMGIYNVPPSESGLTSSRTFTERGTPVYEALISASGQEIFVRLEQPSDELILQAALFAVPGERDLWTPVAREILASVGIRGVVTPPALNTAPDPEIAAYPPESAPVTFAYPRDSIVVIYPADDVIFLADLHNKLDALRNVPDPQTGLTHYDSGEFTLRVLVMRDSLAHSVVEFLENRLRELAPEVYTIGTLETLLIGSRDAARVRVDTSARDGLFTALAIDSGTYALLSASAATREIDLYAQEIALVAETIRLNR